MNNAHERLVTCFSTVFPALSRAEVVDASSDSVDNWDSLAIVTLLAVIEEEFAVQLPPDEVETLVSFHAFWTYLKPRISSNGNSAGSTAKGSPIHS